MVANNQVPFLYRKWVEENDDFSELSVRAFFLVWWLDRMCDGKQNLPMLFPLPHGNINPVSDTDAAFVEAQEMGLVDISTNEHQGREIKLTGKGRSFLLTNTALCDSLDTKFEIK